MGRLRRKVRGLPSCLLFFFSHALIVSLGVLVCGDLAPWWLPFSQVLFGGQAPWWLPFSQALIKALSAITLPFSHALMTAL